jgi:hypothetical protein
MNDIVQLGSEEVNSAKGWVRSDVLVCDKSGDGSPGTQQNGWRTGRLHTACARSVGGLQFVSACRPKLHHSGPRVLPQNWACLCMWERGTHGSFLRNWRLCGHVDVIPEGSCRPLWSSE